MKPIAVFFHCVFRVPDGSVPPHAETIISGQMAVVRSSGLLSAANRLCVGVNGGAESCDPVRRIIPGEFCVGYHGARSLSETPTMVAMWEFSKANPGWNVLYFHSKGATHTDVEYLKFVTRWRNCMMNALIVNWAQCITDLDSGFESVGCHWMTNMSPPSDKDSIWGGNFFWATSNFIATLPDILDRDLIKNHGITAPIARYEGERWIGSGPKLPKIKDYHINGIGSCP